MHEANTRNDRRRQTASHGATSCAWSAARAGGRRCWLVRAGVRASGRKIKIGYVSPQTGPLAPFGEADNFVLGR